MAIAIPFGISGFAGLVAETGDIADPSDKIFRILIRAMTAVPVQPGIHILVPVQLWLSPQGTVNKMVNDGKQISSNLIKLQKIIKK
jgi:hypothetical protein